MTDASATASYYVHWGRPRNSWHIVTGGAGNTLCGRWFDTPAEWQGTLPAAKSCETCLRIARRRTDVEP